jgi:hypothetical protein
MPAKSKKQQRFFGMVHAVQKGEIEPPSKEVAETAKSIGSGDAEDFASTKHKGLPMKKKEKKSVDMGRVNLLTNFILLKEAGLLGMGAPALGAPAMGAKPPAMPAKAPAMTGMGAPPSIAKPTKPTMAAKPTVAAKPTMTSKPVTATSPKMASERAVNLLTNIVLLQKAGWLDKTAVAGPGLTGGAGAGAAGGGGSTGGGASSGGAAIGKSSFGASSASSSLAGARGLLAQIRRDRLTARK